MPNELIATLIKFLPTILFGLIVLGSILGGFIKGFRKSTILFIHYFLSLVVGFVTYFVLSKKIVTMDLNFLFSAMGGEYVEAHTIYDFIRILLEQTSLASYSALTGNYYIQGVIDAFAGIIINFVLGIAFLIVLPWILRFIFRLFYIIFYSERKYKKHKLAEGEEYHRHRFLGMGVGLLRGVVCATLIVSFVTAAFFMVAGGESFAADEEKEIQLLDYLSEGSDVDLNAYYNALKQSRSTGVGLIYDKIKIKGKALDSYYFDLYASSNFKSYDFSSKDETTQVSQTIIATLEDGTISNLSVRQELALLMGLFEGLLENNIIVIEDGEIKPNEEALINEGTKITSNYVEQSVFFSDIVPLMITGVVEEVQKGNVSVQEDIDKYIVEHNVYSKVRKIDFAGDISTMINSIVPLVEILMNEKTGEIDFAQLGSAEALLGLDPEVVDKVFKNLSEITLITEVVFPIGIGVAFNSFETQLKEAGIATDDIDLSIINWKFELANLGEIFKYISALELDMEKLGDTSISKTDSSKTVQMEYLTNYLKEENNKSKLLDLVDGVMDSNLTSQFALVMVKKYITDLNIVNEDGSTNTDLSNSLQKVKANLNARDPETQKLLYTTEHLADDLHTFIESCLGLVDLIGAFSGETDDPIQMLKNIPADSLRAALIGEEYDGTEESLGGLYKISFLSGDLDADGKVEEHMENATDAMIESLLLSYAKNVFLPEDIAKVTDPAQGGKGWPKELDSLISCIETIQGNEELSNLSLSGDLTSIALSDPAVDDLTESCSKSILIGSLITSKIEGALSSEGTQDTIKIPEDAEWLDSFDPVTEKVVARGELNKMLKILKVFNDPEKGIDLNDPDTLISGLAKLNTEATGDKKNEVDILTSSVILTNSLNGIVCEMLYPNGEKDQLDIDVTWENTYDDNGQLVEQGELQTFVEILNIEKLQSTDEETNEKSFDPNKLSDVNTIASLETPEIDTLTSSKIVNEVLNDKVTEMLYPDEEKETLNVDVTWENTYENGELVEQGELQTFVNILNISHLRNEENEVDPDKLSDVDTIAQLITRKQKEGSEDEFYDDYTDAVSIAQSKIIMSMMSDKISSVSSEDVKIIVPEKLKYDENTNKEAWKEWAYVEEGESKNYKDGEFVKMVYTLYSARNHVISIEDGTKYDKLTTENLVEGVIGMPNHDAVTNSLVMYATLSDKLISLSEEENPTIQIRAEAFVEREHLASNNNIELKQSEVTLALDAVRDLEIIDFTNVNVGTVIEKVGDENIREQLCKSNILNKTIVNKIVTSDSQDISFGGYDKLDAEKNDYNSNWYPAFSSEEDWVNCELNKLLRSINELDITTDENDNISVDSQIVIYKMNDENQEEEIVADVIFESHVMSHTITMHIDKYKDDGTIKIRDEAYENSLIKSAEIVVLVDFLEGDQEDETDDIKLDDKISTQQVFDKLGNDADRKNICTSNILNITVVDKIVNSDSDDIAFGGYDTFDTQKNDYNSNWYPAFASEEDWVNCELNKLLRSINELDIKADENDNISVDSQTVIYKMNDENQEEEIIADVVFESHVMSHTITMHIDKYKDDGTIKIRDEAYESSLIKSAEIVVLVNFLEGDQEDETDDIKLDEQISTKQVFDKLENDTDRENICTSNILNITVVDKLVINSDGNLIFGEYALKDGNGNYAYDYNSNWYPAFASEEDWVNCELNKLLLSVVDLNIGVDTNDKVVVELGTIICDLHKDSSKVNEKEKIEVAYDSDVMIQTINKYLNDNIGQDKDIQARESAYYLHNDDTNKKYVKSDEISILSLFLDSTGLSIESGDNKVTTKAVLDAISRDDANIELICNSNILNITLVGKIITADGLKLTSDYDDVADADWYYSDAHYDLGKQDRLDNVSSIDCELKRMLVSVSTLNLQTDAEDENKLLVDSNALINELKDDAKNSHGSGEKKITKVYKSRVFAKTFSVEILNSIAVPLIDTDGNTVIGDNDIISDAEVTNMVTAIGILGLDLSNDIDASHAIESIEIINFAGNVDDILLSATIHYMISDELIYKQAVTTTYYATNSEATPSITPISAIGVGGYSTVAVKKNEAEIVKSINVIYSKKEEIQALFNGFIQIDNDIRENNGTGLSLGGALDTTSLIEGLSLEAIEKIYNSTLLSYLFSHSIISGTISNDEISLVYPGGLRYYQAVGFMVHGNPNYFNEYLRKVNELNFLNEDNEEGFISINNVTEWNSFSMEEVKIILTEIQNIN